MENRDRDKMSQGSSSTDTGDVNRSTSSRQGQKSSDSKVDFGKKIGSSEELGSEPSRRSGSSDSSSSSSSNSSDSGRSSGGNSEH